MTKKDYILIADILIYRYNVCCQILDNEEKEIILDIMKTFAKIFKENNSNFDEDKWQKYIDKHLEE